MRIAGIIVLCIGGVTFAVGLVSAIADGSIGEVFSHFGEGRGNAPTIWWLVVPMLFFIVGTLLMKNANRGKEQTPMPCPEVVPLGGSWRSSYSAISLQVHGLPVTFGGSVGSFNTPPNKQAASMPER